MFLHPRFFKKSYFDCLYKSVVKNLQNKGITVVSIDDIIEYQNNGGNLLFDEMKFPNQNILYIHMFNGYYYNDDIYSKKKLEKEREMILLLAGKLGVKKISYTIEFSETTFEKLNGEIKVQNIDSNIKYSKNTKKTSTTSSTECYLNRGAPVYLLSNDINEVNHNIKTKLGSIHSNIFSYDFYKKNPKLEGFVYKRFEFKMLNLDYTIESEDISDKSFEVKTFLMDCGIGFAYDNNKTINEKITYNFDFFTDKELRIELLEINRRFNDMFIEIREAYDESDNKDNSVQYICEYVMNEIKKYTYKNKNKIINLYEDFDDWYNKQEKETFENICHEFVTSHQINEWIVRTFKDDKEEFKKLDKQIINISSSAKNEFAPQLKRSLNDNDARIKIAIEACKNNKPIIGGQKLSHKIAPQIRRSMK
jgi:hypothetical protein